MSAPMPRVPVFSLPDPGLCDHCGSGVDVCWFTTSDNRMMVLCPACADVGGASDLPYGGDAA